MSRLRKALLATLTLAFFATSTFVCSRVADRGRFTSAYSSYGSGPKGARGLYLLAESLGLSPRRWSQDLAALPRRAMLVALGDCESGMARPLSRYEEQELVRWVEQGGVLLVAGARHYLPDGLGVRFESEPRCTPEWRILRTEKEKGAGEGEPSEQSAPELQAPPEPGASQPATDSGTIADLPEANDDVAWTSPVDRPLLGLEPLPMRQPGRLVLDDGADERVILSMPDALNMPDSPIQREVGVVVKRGNGRVIALASGSMLQNRALAAADGGVLFARLAQAYAQDGPILFDEYHLGVGERRSMMRYLRQAGASPFIAQLMFVALLLLWRSGARFGGVRQPPEAPPAGTASYVGALGGLFARAGDQAGAAHVLVKQGLTRVAAYHHLPPSAARALAGELSERGLLDAAAAVRAIADAERGAIRGEPGGLARLSREIDRAVARACP
jgi:hypothetical protein